MQINQNTIAGIMFALNWQGHVEPPDSDIQWMASEIAKALTGSKRGICENCGSQSAIIVKVPVGDICEDCITNIGRMADSIREEYESGGRKVT